MSPGPRAVAVLNPVTGRRRAGELEALLRATLERRFDLEIVRTGSPGEARALARRAAQHARIVIAVGGDGTVSDVASGVIDTGAALAIIPTGSTNVVARSLGIPLDPVTAARMLLRPLVVRRLDVATDGDRLTLHMAGAGFDALMLRDARRDWKRAAAWLAYVPSAVRHLSEPPWHFELCIDGVVHRVTAHMVLVANGAFIINRWFRMGRSIFPDDGILDVCVFAPTRRLGIATMALWVLVGSVDRSRYYHQFRGRDVLLSAVPPAPIELDGDFAGWTPVHFRMRAAALRVVVPGPPGTGTAGEWLDLDPHERPQTDAPCDHGQAAAISCR